jgi:hypothetical protein
MAQQQHESQGNELSFELLKNTQHIAEQAAIRAKEIAMRSSKVPDIPTRGGSEQQKAPEIPPKRLSLKKTVLDDNFTNGAPPAEPIPIPQRNQERKPPPPVPMKPSSAQNSPRLKDKLTHPAAAVPTMMNTVTTTASSSLPQQQMFHERVIQQPQQQNSPQLSAKNQNIVNILNSPLFQQRANQYKLQQQQQQAHMMMSRQMKASDDEFGSEDALRGIERGLKNMERAMKEQMTMRNMDLTDGKGGEVQFNPMEFKRSLGGSFNSLENGPQTINTMRVMGSGNMRLNFDGQSWGQRQIERNFSMDQMSIALQNAGMKGIPIDPFSSAQQQPPKHNIYRSLDRTLPLELQFSRHRQQQELEFMRQNNQILNLRQQQQQQQQQGLSREDLNLRRRSSHDETQYIMHQQKQATASSANATNADNSGGMLMTLS